MFTGSVVATSKFILHKIWLGFILMCHVLKELEMFCTNIIYISVNGYDLVFCHYTRSLRKI
jgi:hypothetical protein